MFVKQQLLLPLPMGSKRHVQEYAIDPQARAGTQFSCTAQHTLFHILHFGADCDLLVSFFPGQAFTSGSELFSLLSVLFTYYLFPDEGVLPEYNSHILYSPSVNSSMFNTAHILEPMANFHQPRSAYTISSDPALTYLPGYWAIISPIPVVPMQLKLQDVPTTEPSEGTKFVTAYTLNKQYGFSRTQSVCATVLVNSIALTCTDIPKLVQQYRYFAVPTLSDFVARHCLQKCIRISSIIAEHQCDPACPGYNDIFVFHWLKRPWTVKHNLGLSSRFFEVAFDNSPHDDGPVPRI
jgi:hypothetical protein